MKDLLDNLIDSFSSKELRARVRAVIAVGLLVMAAAFAGLYYLNTRMERISIPGSAQWTEDGSLAISLPPDKLQSVAEMPEISAEFLDPARGYIDASVRVLEIDPSTSVITVDGSKLPAQLKPLTRMDVKLIIVDMPFWQMLWGR